MLENEDEEEQRRRAIQAVAAIVLRLRERHTAVTIAKLLSLARLAIVLKQHHCLIFMDLLSTLLGGKGLYRLKAVYK